MTRLVTVSFTFSYFLFVVLFYYNKVLSNGRTFLQRIRFPRLHLGLALTMSELKMMKYPWQCCYHLVSRAVGLDGEYEELMYSCDISTFRTPVIHHTNLAFIMSTT